MGLRTMRTPIMRILVLWAFLAMPGCCQGHSFYRGHHPLTARSSIHKSSTRDPRRPLNPRAQRFLDKELARISSEGNNRDYDDTHDNLDQEEAVAADDSLAASCLTASTKAIRGGQEGPGARLVQVVTTITNMLIAGGKLVLPPAVAMVQAIASVYQQLPTNVLAASTGLVYCFAGGYYPTLFSSMAAAQQYGWNVVVTSIGELTDEALRVMEALDEAQFGQSSRTIRRPRGGASTVRGGSSGTYLHRTLLEATSIVLATVDPVKINQAAGALYTTWLGVSSVLEKKYAQTITLSLTLADYLETMVQFILGPPAYFCVAEQYHQWVPVVIGWICKGAAMNVAWRIQRVMTAATSAVTGGLMFARAITRMLSKRGIGLLGLIPTSPEQDEALRQTDEVPKTPLEEGVGFLIAALGFYTQFEAQWRNGFSFEVPFPVSLITWPFDFAERWIQWRITK